MVSVPLNLWFKDEETETGEWETNKEQRETASYLWLQWQVEVTEPQFCKQHESNLRELWNLIVVLAENISVALSY